MKPVVVAVVGAGQISDIYLKNMINRFDILTVKSICAAHLESAQKRAAQYDLIACTYEEILADPEIEMIVNLTPACNHYDIIRRALEAGKHVYTEKTMTDDPKTARELVELAAEKGLYLGSAPDTFLGSALQTARKAIDDGLIGEVTSCTAAANRDNNFLLSVASFLRMPGGGICFDYGVYYMTALVSLLGPVDRVGAFVRAPYPTHLNNVPGTELYGQVMDTPNESQVSAILQFESGITGTLHLNADSVLQDQAYLAVYGSKGILYLTDPNGFGGQVVYLENNWEGAERKVLPCEFGFSENSRGVGPAEMAWAIREGRQHRTSMEMAAHVVDVLAACIESQESERIIHIESTCERPAPMGIPANGEESALH